MRASASVLACVALLVAACSSSSSSTPAAPTMGPQCQKYYGSGGCCLEVAGDQQGLKDACAQGKKAIDDGLANGGDANSYESTCDQAVKAAQAAGKCK